MMERPRRGPNGEYIVDPHAITFAEARRRREKRIALEAIAEARRTIREAVQRLEERAEAQEGSR